MNQLDETIFVNISSHILGLEFSTSAAGMQPFSHKATTYTAVYTFIVYVMALTPTVCKFKGFSQFVFMFEQP